MFHLNSAQHPLLVIHTSAFFIIPTQLEDGRPTHATKTPQPSHPRALSFDMDRYNFLVRGEGLDVGAISEGTWKGESFLPTYFNRVSFIICMRQPKSNILPSSQRPTRKR